jgi:hypothetical protein
LTERIILRLSSASVPAATMLCVIADRPPIW